MKKNIIVVVDDCAIFRSGLKALFTKANRALIFKEADGQQGVLQYSKSETQNIFFISANGYIGNSVLAAQKPLAQLPPEKIIVCYDEHQEPVVQDLFDQLSGNSFIYKNASPNEFLLALEQTLKKGRFFCSRTLQLLSSHMAQAKEKLKQAGRRISFTKRQEQIIHLICEEYTAKEIAGKLALSKRTVENQKTKIQEKMQVKNMAGIVKYAYKNNLVQSDPSKAG